MTKTKWTELTPKQQWDVYVALRGPDCQHSDPIKWLTTAVIRWAMGGIMRVGGAINADGGGVIVPADCHTLDDKIRATQGGLSALSWSSTHFFSHVTEAAMILGLPVYVIPPEVYFKAVSKHSTSKVLYILWLWAKEKGSEPLQAALALYFKSATNKTPETIKAEGGEECL